MTPDILIYQDYVHNNGVLYRRLCEHYGHGRVAYCDAQDILSGLLHSGVHLFVMPGGADLYYCEKLNGAGNTHIADYVRGGGNYLGICAGAYYACHSIEWAKGQRYEICSVRELGFADSRAVGPVYEFLEEGNIDKSWKNIVPLSIATEQEIETSCLYDAGPVFVDINSDTVNILARYKSLAGSPAAIIETRIGKGKVILSSPHIEYNGADAYQTLYKLYNTSYERELFMARELEHDKTLNLLSFFLHRFETA
jgi:glutamine amidotransferase-like uncharacterized protein